MIRVFASRHRDHYRLLVEGHAKGHPDAALVCAATSALTQALVELVQKSEACHHVRCCVESGRVFLSCRARIAGAFELVLTGLARLAEQYPACIRLVSVDDSVPSPVL